MKIPHIIELEAFRYGTQFECPYCTKWNGVNRSLLGMMKHLTKYHNFYGEIKINNEVIQKFRKKDTDKNEFK
jgi:hypothetical protein